MMANSSDTVYKKIGRYPILGKLGSGGMGAVFKARHPDTNIAVAIKIVTLKDPDPKLLRRFEQEISAACRLSHPNLVRGLDYGIQDESPYLVMEYVEGETLGDRIAREGRLDEGESLRIIGQAALAIDYVHRRGIIHRDVKPDNILLTANGLAKLTDLGLIKNTGMDLNLTGIATCLGTPNFMAPEQFSDARAVESGCDVYSLGATLYMALTGDLPFDAPTDLAILKKKLTDSLTPKKKLAVGVSDRVEEAIRRSVRSDASQRFPDISSFMEAVTGAPLPPPAAETSGPVTSDEVERRQAVRYRSNASGRCTAVGGEEGEGWPVKVKDVSATGIGLLVRRRFEPRTLLYVEAAASPEKSGQTYMVRVVRTRDLGGGVWLIGACFGRRIDDEEIKALV